MIKKCALILWVGLTGMISVFGQREFPAIGKPMPEFTLREILDFPPGFVSSKSLKGKWYILDFWIMGCQPCIESFPKLSEMAKKFDTRVRIFSVGIGGEELKNYYFPIRKRKGLKIPMAFDRLLAEKWQVNSYPLIFIVDDKGILRAITSETNAEKLEALIAGGENRFSKPQNYKQYQLNDASRLYFLSGNGGNDSSFLFRSIIARASPDYSSAGIANLNQRGPEDGDLEFVSSVNLRKGLFQLSKTSLIRLYNTAYFGQDRAWITDSIYGKAVLLPAYVDKVLWPVLQVRDSSDFRTDYKTLQGLFTYSLAIPPEKANRQYMMRAMQLDLFKFFGYEAKIEIRQWPVWKLKVKDPQKLASLKTKGGDPQDGTLNDTLHDLINVTSFQVMARIFGENQFKIFFDETGIDYRIDIRLEGSLRDMDAVKRELNRNGLDMVEESRDMKVLVISDPLP